MENKFFKKDIRKHPFYDTLQTKNRPKGLHSIKSAENLLKESGELGSRVIKKQFDEVKVLALEKDRLIKELDMLKQGAVTALLQKQQQIQKLKNYPQQQIHFEDQKQQMQKQLAKLNHKIKELQQQNMELCQQKQKSRNFFFQQLYNKQAAIDSHVCKIASLEQYIDRITQQNSKLQKKLEEQEIKYQDLEIETQMLKLQFLNYKKQINQTHASNSISLQKMYDFQMQQNLHKKQIQDLTAFYQNKINVIQNLYHYDMNLKKSLLTQEQSEQQNKDSVCGLNSYKSIYQPHILKADLFGNLQSTWKTDDSFDCNSQITPKYYDYIQRKRRSITQTNSPTRLIKCEDNYELQNREIQQQQQILQVQRKLQKTNYLDKKFWLPIGCGYVIGMISGHYLTKIFT